MIKTIIYIYIVAKDAAQFIGSSISGIVENKYFLASNRLVSAEFWLPGCWINCFSTCSLLQIWVLLSQNSFGARYHHIIWIRYAFVKKHTNNHSKYMNRCKQNCVKLFQDCAWAGGPHAMTPCVSWAGRNKEFHQWNTLLLLHNFKWFYKYMLNVYKIMITFSRGL